MWVNSIFVSAAGGVAEVADVEPVVAGSSCVIGAAAGVVTGGGEDVDGPVDAGTGDVAIGSVAIGRAVVACGMSERSDVGVLDIDEGVAGADEAPTREERDAGIVSLSASFGCSSTSQAWQYRHRMASSLISSAQ